MMALWVGETMGFLAGCASTHLQTVKSAPEFQPGSVTRVLVVSVARTPEVRGVVEQEFARQWRERGVEADASSRVMPAGVPLDKAGIGPFAKAQGYSHVLVNRLMSRNEVEAETPESKTNLSAETKTIVASPQYDIDYQVAVVRTNLYDTAHYRRKRRQAHFAVRQNDTQKPL